MRYISRESFSELLDTMQKDYDIFVPVKKGEARFYRRYTSTMKVSETEESTLEESILIGGVRPFEPLKVFFMKSRQKVADGYEDIIPRAGELPHCIVGVKACDLKGFKVHDRVFIEDDYRDPFYIREREENFIISADCTSAIDTCYCHSFHVNPYPQENFDINLSSVSGGFIVEAGSQKGTGLIEDNSDLFVEAKGELISERDEQRKRVLKEVKKNILEHNIPDQNLLQGVIEARYQSPIWKEEADACVECGACNMICPTCHCFLLYDQKDEERMARLRVWDSCMMKDFARVAGGANPRPQLWMRLRNRFEKKFDFFPKIADIYACTGCGRCISACPAKIDIRRVLKRLVENV